MHILEATLGGTLRYLENIAAATDLQQITPALAYGSSRSDSRFQPLLRELQAAGWSTYSVDMRRELDPFRDLSALYTLRQTIQVFAPDIVHCHSSKAGGVGRVAAFLQPRRIARLYSPHALAAPLGSKYLHLEKILARITDGFVSVSESERSELVSYRLAQWDEIDTVYPSVDSAFFAPTSKQVARSSLGLDGSPLVLGIGRLTAQKDPEAFVRIVAGLHELRPDVRAIWVGAGEQEAQFHDQVCALGLEGVVQLAPWQHDVRPYIAAADVLLSTSRFESFGYMVAEALAMQLPVVASDVTGTRDIMEGALAQWLYPAGDRESAVKLLLSLLEDEAHRSRVGELGRCSVQQRFSRKRMGAALLETYQRALLNINPQGVPKRPQALSDRPTLTPR